MKKNRAKHGSKRKKNTLLIKLILLVVIFLIVIKSITTNNVNKEKILYNNSDIKAELVQDTLILDKVYYMSFEDVKTYLDETIYIEENAIITSSEKKIAKLEIDNNIAEINGAQKEMLLGPIKKGNIIYIPVSEMKEIYDIDFNYSEKSKIAVIDDLSLKQLVATSKKKISLKEGKNLFSNTICKIQKGDQVVVLEQEENYAKIRSKDGYIGYIKVNKLDDIHVLRENYSTNEKQNDGKTLKKEISDYDLTTFENRKRIINDIWKQAVIGEYIIVEVTNKNEKFYDRFKIESKPIFKEAGIQIEFK